MAVLKINDEEVVLRDDVECSIGRDPKSTVVIPIQKVSRSHARIIARNGRFFIEDCNSACGTFVNGSRISTPVELPDRAEIGIGDAVVLKFVQSESSSKGTAPSTSRADLNRPPARANSAPEGGFAVPEILYTDETMALKKRIHEKILQDLNLRDTAAGQQDDSAMRAKIEAALGTVLRDWSHELPKELKVEILRPALLDELIAYGPITPLLNDPTITEVMVNGPFSVWCERGGRLFETQAKFFDERHLMTIIRRIVERVGRHIDESSPRVDARLPDGSRVNAVVPPVALDGACLTIRKFSDRKLNKDDLIAKGTLTADMAAFLEEAVRARQNIVISGGTGSGKTTFLNVVSQFIPPNERVVTIEDSAELRLTHKCLVRLEARPPNVEGKGRVSIQDLVINALRMRPDRIIVGECRGAEALDMLQAMNTGHDGSLTTVHANSARDALARMETMVLMAGYDLPTRAIREQIASAVNFIIQEERLVDGSRKVVQISEVTGREGDVILTQDVFMFEETGTGPDGRIRGRFKATGNRPTFIDKLEKKGDLRISKSLFVDKG